jgi:hypothetical protein
MAAKISGTLVGAHNHGHGIPADQGANTALHEEVAGHRRLLGHRNTVPEWRGNGIWQFGSVTARPFREPLKNVFLSHFSCPIAPDLRAFGPTNDRYADEARGSANPFCRLFTTFLTLNSIYTLSKSISGALFAVTYGRMTVFGPSDNQTATNVVAFLSTGKLITTLNDILAAIRYTFAAVSDFC